VQAEPDEQAMRAAVAARLAEGGARRVVIRADPGVPLQRAIDMLDLVRGLGATDISLARRR